MEQPVSETRPTIEEAPIAFEAIANDPVWIAAHLLAILIYLEDRFGPQGGETVATIASSILDSRTTQE